MPIMLHTHIHTHIHTHTHTHTHTQKHLTTHPRLVIGLDDQRHKEVQDCIDEQYQKDGDEDLAEYEDSIVIVCAHPSVGVPEVITIEHGEEGVE